MHRPAPAPVDSAADLIELPDVTAKASLWPVTMDRIGLISKFSLSVST